MGLSCTYTYLPTYDDLLRGPSIVPYLDFIRSGQGQQGQGETLPVAPAARPGARAGLATVKIWELIYLTTKIFWNPT